MSDILRRARLVNREIFDPSNEAHVESLKVFLRTGNWGDIQFYPEVPYTEAPATVMTKFARHVLGIQLETPVERAERLRNSGVAVLPTPIESAEATAHRLATANALVRAQLQAMQS